MEMMGYALMFLLGVVLVWIIAYGDED